MKLIDDLEKQVKLMLENKPKQSIAHRWGHLHRVRQKALEIARSYSDADTEIIEIAALLHDIDQPFDKKGDHVNLSVNLARQLLQKMQYSMEKIEMVLEVIKHHSTEDLSQENISNEAKILFDADKLDGLGPIGIARVFALCGQRGIEPEQAIEWYEGKIETALGNIKTKEGAMEAQKLLPYVRDFLSRIKMNS